MANGTRFQFRMWWTSMDPEGYCDAHLYTADTKYEALRLWQSAINFRWVPHGHDRACVSQVQLWRSDSGGTWFRYGEMPDTADTWHDWPKCDIPEDVDVAEILTSKEPV